MAQMKKLETVVSICECWQIALEKLCDAVDVTAEAPTKQVEKGDFTNDCYD